MLNNYPGNRGCKVSNLGKLIVKCWCYSPKQLSLCPVGPTSVGFEEMFVVMFFSVYLWKVWMCPYGIFGY